MKKFTDISLEKLNEAKSRFGKLVEYSFISKPDQLLLDEDDEDEMNPEEQPQMDSTPPSEEHPQSELPQGGEGENLETELPQDNVDGNLEPELPQESETEFDDQMPDVDNNPMGDTNNEVEVDVTDLTKSQDDVSLKVNDLTAQNSQVLDLLSNVTNKIEQLMAKTEMSDMEVKSIKQEIEKRNPTPKEVLQKRITVGDPFSETPEDYWNKKETEGNYKLSDTETTERTYEIKPNDLNDNNLNIYKSFGLNDNELNQTLKNVVGY